MEQTDGLTGILKCVKSSLVCTFLAAACEIVAGIWLIVSYDMGSLWEHYSYWILTIWIMRIIKKVLTLAMGILLIATGILFLKALRETVLEKAEKELHTVCVLSRILIVLSLISFVCGIIGWMDEYLSNPLFGLADSLAFVGSCMLFASAGALKNKKIEKLPGKNTAFFCVLIVLCIGFIGIASAINPDFYDIITNIILIIVCIPILIYILSLIGKALKNPVIKGAAIGGLIAGDKGAIIGAIAAAAKDKQDHPE